MTDVSIRGGLLSSILLFVATTTSVASTTSVIILSMSTPDDFLVSLWSMMLRALNIISSLDLV